MKAQAAFALLALLSSIRPLQAEAQTARLFTRAEYLMGTVFQVQLEAPSEQSADRLFAGIFDILRAHDQALSDYQPDSELNLALQRAPSESVSLSPILCHALRESLGYARISEGSFDISVGPLVRLWGFKDGDFRVPSPADQQAARSRSQLSQIHLSGCQLRTEAGLELDFGGIGKGLALDAAGSWLRAQGVQVAAFNAGGSSLLLMGAPAGSPRGWPLVLRQNPIQEPLWLRDQAVSTSGDDQQFFVSGQRRYSHLFDPRTGQPIRWSGSITVRADSAATAEAMSKALLLLTEAQQRELIRQYGLKVWTSPGPGEPGPAGAHGSDG
ncbi:MAG: FAD:protein FMN transferase [Candidatus Sericytochromatia bacterium]